MLSRGGKTATGKGGDGNALVHHGSRLDPREAFREKRTVMDTVHVLPVNDLIEHELEDCPCGPQLEPVFDADGSCGWLISHQSLDGRENHEARS